MYDFKKGQKYIIVRVKEGKPHQKQMAEKFVGTVLTVYRVHEHSVEFDYDSGYFRIMKKIDLGSGQIVDIDDIVPNHEIIRQSIKEILEA